MVDPEYRRAGIGKMLFIHAFERDMMTIGNNPSPGAESLMLKAGFRKIPSGRTMVFPLQASHILKWIIPERLQFLASPVGAILQPYFSYKASSLRSNQENFHECPLDELEIAVSRKQESSHDSQVLHDITFLEWRANGFMHYSPAFSRMKTSAGSYAVHGAFKPSYNVYDWSCNSLDETREMISVILPKAKSAACRIIQIVANSTDEEDWLSSLGFIRARHEENIIHFSRDGFLNESERFRFTLYDTDLNL
jgi:hypothetical protein